MPVLLNDRRLHVSPTRPARPGTARAVMLGLHRDGHSKGRARDIMIYRGWKKSIVSKTLRHFPPQAANHFVLDDVDFVAQLRWDVKHPW